MVRVGASFQRMNTMNECNALFVLDTSFLEFLVFFFTFCHIMAKDIQAFC